MDGLTEWVEAADSPLTFLDTDSVSGGGAIHTGPVRAPAVATLRSQIASQALSLAYMVFAFIGTVYILLIQRLGSEDHPLALFASLVGWFRDNSRHDTCSCPRIPRSRTRPRLVHEQSVCLFFPKWFVANSIHASGARTAFPKTRIQSGVVSLP